MIRSIRIAGIGPHVDTVLDLPPRAEISGPSESGKTAILVALTWLLWGTGPDGKAGSDLLGAGAVSVEATTTKGTVISRRRTAGGAAHMTLGAAAYDTQRDFGAALKAFGKAAQLRPMLVPFGWMDLLQGPGDGRPLREWLVEHLPGESIDSALDGIRPGEADGRDHRARVKEAAARVTRANRNVDRHLGMLDEATRNEPVQPEAPDPIRLAELRDLAARHAEQTQAQADARAAVKVWQAAVGAHRRAQDDHRAWSDRKAALVPPREERPAHEALTAAADAKVRAADAEAAARRAKAEVDTVIGDARRVIDHNNRAINDLGDPPGDGACAGVKKGCRLAADADRARERWQERADSYSAERARATERLDAALERLPEVDADVERATKAASEARAAYLRLQDAQLKWTRYDAEFAKLGAEPVIPADPGPQPQIPDVDPLPEDAEAEIRYRNAQAMFRHYVANREARIRDLTAALAEARAAADRAKWVLDTLRAAPGRVLGARLAALKAGPVTFDLADDGEALALRIDGRPWNCASHGRRVVADAWLRRALADAAGCAWLPIIVDEAESATGPRQTLPPGPLWALRSTPTGALAVRPLES